VQNVVNNVVNLVTSGTCSELHVKYEQVKSEQGRKEIAGESADAREDDVIVDGDSRVKLEQLVKRLQDEVMVGRVFVSLYIGTHDNTFAPAVTSSQISDRKFSFACTVLGIVMVMIQNGGISDVNKDWTHKDKDYTCKDKDLIYNDLKITFTHNWTYDVKNNLRHNIRRTVVILNLKTRDLKR